MKTPGKFAGLGLAGLLLLAGCANRPAGAPNTPAALQATIAATPRLPAVAAEALVRIAEAGQDPETVTLRFWLDAKGRLRLRGTKVDVAFLDLLVEADGRVLAVDPRAKTFTRFPLGDPRLPSLLRFLPRLTDELRRGPLAAGDPVITATSTGHAEGHLADGSPVAYVLDPNGDPLAVTIDQLTIRYDRWQEFDGVHRPSRLHLTVEGTDLRAVLTRFDALGALSPERMALTIPDGAPDLPLDRFLDQLGR